MNRRDFLKMIGAATISSTAPVTTINRLKLQDPRDIPEEIMNDGNWHHFALVNRFGLETLYIDGEMVSYAVVPKEADFNTVDFGPLHLQGLEHTDVWTLEFFMLGNIDSLLIDRMRLTEAARMPEEFFLSDA